MSLVEYIGHHGDDLLVVNAARVSYDKQHDQFDESDERLLNYLVRNNHISPFFHPTITFRITCNIAVANQLKRHQVGLAINEVSRRYVDSPPTFDLPTQWRGRPRQGQSKQGSGDRIQGNDEDWVHFIATRSVERAAKDYQELLDNGVSPEQARLVLPMAMETSFYWTGSLYAFVRVCRERMALDAQAETRIVAVEICEVLRSLYPRSLAAWLGEDDAGAVGGTPDP